MATQTEQGKQICVKCGSGIRDSTAFCYNCGTPVQEEALASASPTSAEEPEMDGKTRAALDDLAERLKEDARNDGQMTKAANERRRARVAQKKPLPTVWEPDNGGPGVGLIVVTLIVLIAAGLVVYLRM